MRKADVGSLAIDPIIPTNLYAAQDCGFRQGGDAFRSIDGGASWSVMALSGAVCITAFAIDPVTTRTLYAGTASYYGGYQVIKSTDGGESWSYTGRLEGYYVSSLAIDPLNTANLYAGTTDWGNPGEVLKSTDGGESWSSLGLQGYPVLCLAFDPKDPATLYAGNSNGLFRYHDDPIISQSTSGNGGGCFVSTALNESRWKK
jgi:hypothetical protein